jgi:general secretion pathway protein D
VQQRETGARRSVQFVEVGIHLELLPEVQANHAITTHIRAEVSSIVSFRSPLQEIPWVKMREAETSVRIERDRWIRLGRLLSREERRTIVSIPVLGDIPVVGQQFRSTSTENVDTEVVNMVSPTLLSS